MYRPTLQKIHIESFIHVDCRDTQGNMRYVHVSLGSGLYFGLLLLTLVRFCVPLLWECSLLKIYVLYDESE